MLRASEGLNPALAQVDLRHIGLLSPYRPSVHVTTLQPRVRCRFLHGWQTVPFLVSVWQTGRHSAVSQQSLYVDDQPPFGKHSQVTLRNQDTQDDFYAAFLLCCKIIQMDIWFAHTLKSIRGFCFHFVHMRNCFIATYIWTYAMRNIYIYIFNLRHTMFNAHKVTFGHIRILPDFTIQQFIYLSTYLPSYSKMG